MCRCALVAFWASVCASVAAAGTAIVSHGLVAVALGAGMACVALAIGASACLTALPAQAPLGRIFTGSVEAARPGGPGLFLDLDAIEVVGVYRFGRELLTCLRGGTGLRTDDCTGLPHVWQAGTLFLTWRSRGPRSSTKLARQLNSWQASGTPVRLVGAKGRCAVLMDDEDRRLVLPELSAHLSDVPGDAPVAW